MREHRDLLERVAADYGVQPRFIVALWGIESSYGSFTGEFPWSTPWRPWPMRAGARRSSQGALQALRILDQGDVTPAQMQGSWAGAMGQSQFMPSSYLAHAVDYDGDGRRDIWSTHADIFASIANYLAKAGWNRPSHLGAPGAAAGQAGGGRGRAGGGAAAARMERSGSGARTGTTCRWWRSTPPCCRWTTARPIVSGVQQLSRLDGVEPVDVFRSDRRRAGDLIDLRLAGAGSTPTWLLPQLIGSFGPVSH